MLAKFLAAALEVVDQAAVAREAQVNVEDLDLGDAGQVEPQGIVVVGPGLDVRRDVAQDVVAGDEEALGPVVERDVTEGVTRRVDDLEAGSRRFRSSRLQTAGAYSIVWPPKRAPGWRRKDSASSSGGKPLRLK